VKAATTLATRLMEVFGEPLEAPLPTGLTHFCPTPERLAGAAVEAIAAVGIIRQRAGSIVALAQAVAAGRLRLEAGADPEETTGRLVALPGIGPWTAHYIAMRALRWPDAFPKEDVALRHRLGDVTPAVAETMAEAWRPWRSYALLHLWREPRAKPPRITGRVRTDAPGKGSAED
jgi:AraC family transcriptional regulator of adaptative response / DNA-3-methyladenine glycosylase II